MTAARAALVLLLLASPAARAADVLSDLGLPQEPPPRGVLDAAGLLDGGTLAQLEDLAMRLRQGSGHEVLLVTLPSLQGHPIEDVGLAIGRAWKLGERDVSDAAVLVVGRDEHALRIEVGRGLEGTLTDLACGRIIRNVIVPRFQQGDFAGGLLEGVKAIHAAAGGDYADIPEDRPVDQTLPPLLALGLILFIVFLLRARRGGGGRRRGWPTVFPFPFPIGVGGSRGGGLGGLSGGLGGGFGGGGGGGFRGFGGGGGGFSGGGASGRW